MILSKRVCFAQFLAVHLIFFQAAWATDFCRDFDVLVKKVEVARELELREPLSCKVVSETEIRSSSYISKQGAALRRTLENDETIYKLLGFIPETYPYRECIFRLGTPTPDALYMPEEKAIFVNKASNAGPERLVMEIIRALQDQHYQARKKEREARGGTDRSLALRGVLDGEGIYFVRELTDAWTVEESTTASLPARLAVGCYPPQALLFISEFPQQFGTRLIRTTREKQGVSGENRLLEKPPETTKELLYSRDLKRDSLLLETLPVQPLPAAYQGEGFVRIHEDVLGEYFIRTLFREHIGSAAALNVARGWSGDRVALYKNKANKKLLLWDSNWVSNDDAREFFQGFRVILGLRFHVDIARNLGGFSFQSGSGDRYMVKLSGRKVSIVVSKDSDSSD